MKLVREKDFAGVKYSDNVDKLGLRLNVCEFQMVPHIEVICMT